MKQVILFLSLFFLHQTVSAEINQNEVSISENSIYTIELQREYQNQSISLDSVLKLAQLKNLEIDKIEIFGRPYLSKTALTLWINNSVQQTEWMSKEGSTSLLAHKGWILGANIHSLQIYVTSMAFIEKIKIYFQP